MPNPAEVATLTCNGQDYTAWKSISVERVWGRDGISVFAFSTSESGTPAKGWAGLKLKPGDPVKVALAGIQVINGNITARSTSLDAQGHEILLQGRSTAAKIVDTAVPIHPGTFNEQTYEQVARGLLAPHGVGLVVRNPPPIFSKPFKSLAPQYGEQIFELLERLASMRGVFHTDDAQGNLVVGQGDPSAAPVATLQEGVNIKSATVRLVNENAWSKMTAVGQNVGDDQNRPPRDQSGTALNPNADTVREKIVIAPHTGYADEMAAHANWHMARDAWVQVQATIVVQGWVRPDGHLWDVCNNITILAPSLFPNDDGRQILGVQTARYTQDPDSGTLTTLECVLPWALSSLLPLNPEPVAGGLTSGGGLGTAKPDAPDTSTTTL